MSEPRRFAHCPVVDPRVEDGPIQFGDDWPGLFLRGDTCMAFAQSLEAVLCEADENVSLRIHCAVLKGLLDDLRSPIIQPKR